MMEFISESYIERIYGSWRRRGQATTLLKSHLLVPVRPRTTVSPCAPLPSTYSIRRKCVGMAGHTHTHHVLVWFRLCFFSEQMKTENVV